MDQPIVSALYEINIFNRKIVTFIVIMTISHCNITTFESCKLNILCFSSNNIDVDHVVDGYSILLKRTSLKTKEIVRLLG